jgi:hypothetical protein
MKRREFIAGLASAAAWPVAARAQQGGMPVVGALDSVGDPVVFSAFRNGLGEAGYIVGQRCGT